MEVGCFSQGCDTTPENNFREERFILAPVSIVHHVKETMVIGTGGGSSNVSAVRRRDR